MFAIQQCGEAEIAKRLLAQVSAVAASSLHQDFLTWERLVEMGRRKAIQEAQGAKDKSELVQLYEEENGDLRARLTATERELADKAAAVHGLTLQLAALKAARTRQEIETAEISQLESVADAVDMAIEHFAEQLVYCPNSKSDGDRSLFQPAREVFQAIEWLATVYHRAKSGAQGCVDFDQSIAGTIAGWHYSGHQKDSTVKANLEWYRCTWNGETMMLLEHLKCGSSKRPEETIRIAFAWHASSSRVIIGYIGQHQKNTLT
ncbi:hypothetical protein [Opitutus sp. ER46]|uniref:hypothetical protein n=1 Tax=Opitutus sp. ER46 TaxID=2161864 RepID=UPI0011B2391A|nr:hypothetical protein [Opitutus sp. ER46]